MKKFKFITACIASVMSLVIIVETGSYISEVNSTTVKAAEPADEDEVDIAVNESAKLGVSGLDFLYDVDSDLVIDTSITEDGSKEIELILNDAIVELKVDNSKSLKEESNDSKESKEDSKDDSEESKESDETTDKEDENASDDDNNLEYVGTFKVTAYCSCSACCGNSNGITASGTKATAGRTIAADTSKFPLGTELTFNGHTYVVEDTGGAISGNRIDLYMSSHQEALNWGVRYCDVYIEK